MMKLSRYLGVILSVMLIASLITIFALFPRPHTILPLSAGYCQIQSAKIVLDIACCGLCGKTT